MNNLAFKFQPAEPESILTTAEYDEAVTFGRSPTLIEEIKADYSAIGLIGEDHNKLLAYLAAISRKSDAPLNVLILSSSGAGKSTIMDKTLKLLPEEDVVRVSSLSDKALFYMPSNGLKNRILALEEAAGMKDSYAMRTLISEGHLNLQTVVGGSLQTHNVEGPVSIFQTTTNPEINAETKSRFFVLGVDESRDQTRAILTAQREACTIEGIKRKASQDIILRKHQNFQRLLQPYAVVNPYARHLFYEDDRLQARRDQPKFLNLCHAVALLRQMGKEIKSCDGLEYIEVEPEDIKIATELATELLGVSLDDLSFPARDLLRQLDTLLPKGKARKDCAFTRSDLMTALGWTKTRLHLHLKELLDLELVVKEPGKRNCLEHYRLLYHGESGHKFLIGLQCS